MLILRNSGMLNLRLTVVLLLMWLAALFNVERLHEPINLASFVYVMAGALAAVIILLPKLRSVTYIELTLLTLPVFAILKWSLGYEFFGSQLPITITECFVLCFTSLLSWRVAQQIDDFIRAAGSMAEITETQDALSMQKGEPRMYGEVQRARRFQRPLAVATLNLPRRISDAQWQMLTDQARQEIARRFVQSRIATTMANATDAGDIVVKDGNRLIVMFPESNRAAVADLLAGVSNNLKEQLGLDIDYGIAEFPEEELTLTGLIERSDAESRSSTRPSTAHYNNSARDSKHDNSAPATADIHANDKGKIGDSTANLTPAYRTQLNNSDMDASHPHHSPAPR